MHPQGAGDFVYGAVIYRGLYSDIGKDGCEDRYIDDKVLRSYYFIDIYHAYSL